MTMRPMTTDPLQRSRSRFRRAGFATVELNLIGWSALVATGLVAGAVVGLIVQVPLWMALIMGIITTWAALVIWDRHRFRNSITHICDDRLDATSGEQIAALLRELGIAATYEEQTFDLDDGFGTQRGILCRQGDSGKVATLMADHLGTTTPSDL